MNLSFRLAGWPRLNFRSGIRLRQLGQIAHLLSGNAANGLLMLLSTAIAARALTTSDFGILILVTTFVRLIERVARFESWQPLIKFAAELEAAEDRHRMARLYLYGLLLDIAAAVAAVAIALLIAAFFAPLFGFTSAYSGYVLIACIAVLFNISGMPTAALRLAGRFRTIAYSQLLSQILRILLALYCWHEAATVQGFLIAWTLAQIVGALTFLWFGFSALRSQSVPSPFSVSPRGLMRAFPGFLSFAWTTNLSMTVRTMTQEVDTLLVGALAGPSAAGFYHIAARLAKVIQQAGAQTQAVLYPDMARHWVQGQFRQLKEMTLHVQLMLGAVGLAALAGAWLLGHFLIGAVFGERYETVTPILLLQLVAMIFVLHAAPSRSVLLSMGRPRFVLAISATGAALFLATAALLIPPLGAIGASLGQILFAAFTALCMDWVWWRTLSEALARNPGGNAVGTGAAS